MKEPNSSETNTSTTRLTDKRGIAAVITVSPRTVNALMASKIIPYLKVGRSVRFDIDDVLAHLREHHRIAAK